MDFLSSMQVEKSYMPPIRVLFVGDDQQFNDFVQLYVEKVLQIKNNLKNENEDEVNQDDIIAEEFVESNASRMRQTTSARKTQVNGH